MQRVSENEYIVTDVPMKIMLLLWRAVCLYIWIIKCLYTQHAWYR